MKEVQLKKYLLRCPLQWRGGKWDGRPKAYADFRGTPTFFNWLFPVSPAVNYPDFAVTVTVFSCPLTYAG